MVVSGRRAALQAAQKIKQQTDEIVDTIFSEDIGKLPDRSITGVLTRVVGLTMDRSVPNDSLHYAVESSGISKDVTSSLTYFKSQYEEGWCERVLSASTAPYDMGVSHATWSPNNVMLTATTYMLNGRGIPFTSTRRVSPRESCNTDRAANVQCASRPPGR